MAGAPYHSLDPEPLDLDLRGLKCPLPVLRTRKALRRMAGGTSLLVRCTDPLAGIDIPHLVREEGHALLRQSHDGEAWAFHIAKSS